NITKSTLNEIKPFTPSGIRDGYAQMTTRLVLAPFGYRPDATWPEAPREFFLGSRLSWYFNVFGIVFYTDEIETAKEILAVPVLVALLEIAKSPLLFRSILGAIERAYTLAIAGQSASQARIELGYGTSFLVSII